MDIEWGKDGDDGKLYILQARPETVKSRKRGVACSASRSRAASSVLAKGRAIGQKIGSGTGARVPDRVADATRASRATCWSPT